MTTRKKISIPVGDWGMHMIDYFWGDRKIRMKDSLQSAVYSQFCKSECSLFPCPEGIYTFLIKPNGNVTWCKRNDEQDASQRNRLSFNTISACRDSLTNIFRIFHNKEDSSTYSSQHTLLPKDFMTNADKQLSEEIPIEWNYIGQQKKHGRD